MKEANEGNLCRMNKFQSPLTATSHASGQAGLLAVAITILIALVLAATSIAGLSAMNAKRSVAIKQSLQTYYAAQAGLQEALATRMVPRSNYWNFNTAGFKKGSVNLSQDQLRYFTRSGLIYQNPDPTNPTGLVGMYRYVILGGDPARKANGSYYNKTETRPLPAGDITKRLLATDSMPPDSSFIILSNGFTCKPSGTAGQVGVAGVDQLNVPTSGTFPANNANLCKKGYTPDEITLIGVASMLPEGGGADRLTRTIIVKDRSKIALPVAAFVPGYGWRSANNTVNFDTVWSSNNSPAVKLKRVVFYNFMTGDIDMDRTVNAGTNNFAKASDPVISASDVIRLYFDGPIDYRSISPANDQNLDACKTVDASNCHIRVDEDVNPAGNCTGPPGSCTYTGMTIIPLLPGSNQVILLPPLNTSHPGNRQAVNIDAENLRSYNGISGDKKGYTILFKTN